MLSFARILVAVLVLLPIVACEQADKGPLEGAWKIEAASYTGPDTSWTITSPQPSLFVFAKQHYSLMFVPGNESRSLFADRSQPTDAEKLGAYNSFMGNSGTYELTDSTVTTRRIIAKNPNLFSVHTRYQVKGDSLWFTLQVPLAAPVGELRYTLVRLE